MSAKMQRMCAVCALVFSVSVSSMSAGVITYVDDDAPFGGDGSSWEKAYKYLQDALGYSADGDEINVAQGRYKPHLYGGGLPRLPGRRFLFLPRSKHRDVAFQLWRSVTLKGGYAGRGAPDPNARDINLHRTVLTGDLWDNDILSDGPYGVLDRVMLDDNSQTVVLDYENGKTHVIDGFTITAGRFGVSCESGSLTARNCHFYRNAGGGQFYGAALSSYAGATIVTDCVFELNGTSSSGAGIRCGSGSVTVRECTFLNNNSHYGGAAISASPDHHGGGGEKLHIEGCVFCGNRAGKDYRYDNRDGTVIGSDWREVTITDCEFIGNTVEGGGVLCLRSSDASIDHCLFAGNDGRESGVLRTRRGTKAIVNACTFFGNRPEGRSILECGLDPNWPNDVAFEDCILWNGEDWLANDDGSIVNVNYSNIQGDWPGERNIDADPCFAKAGHWDDGGTPEDMNDDVWIEGDYHLRSQAGRWDPSSESWVLDDVTSPCLDGGSPATPVGSEPFPNGGRVNMGFYGGTDEASKSYFGSAPCEAIAAGDINGDCVVDWADFAFVGMNWLEDNVPAYPPTA